MVPKSFQKKRFWNRKLSNEYFIYIFIDIYNNKNNNIIYKNTMVPKSVPKSFFQKKKSKHFRDNFFI
jgi:hypothetical protein